VGNHSKKRRKGARYLQRLETILRIFEFLSKTFPRWEGSKKNYLRSGKSELENKCPERFAKRRGKGFKGEERNWHERGMYKKGGKMHNSSSLDRVRGGRTVCRKRRTILVGGKERNPRVFQF